MAGLFSVTQPYTRFREPVVSYTGGEFRRLNGPGRVPFFVGLNFCVRRAHRADRTPTKMTHEPVVVHRFSKPLRPFHPDGDVYPVPLWPSKPYRKREGFDRLWFAVLYLQPKRVEALLKDPEILRRINSRMWHYKQSVLHILSTSNMCSNLPYRSNKDAWCKIARMLLETGRMDLSLKDAFRRTPMANAERYGMSSVRKMLKRYRRRSPRLAAKRGKRWKRFHVFKRQ